MIPSFACMQILLCAWRDKTIAELQEIDEYDRIARYVRCSCVYVRMYFLTCECMLTHACVLVHNA